MPLFATAALSASFGILTPHTYIASALDDRNPGIIDSPPRLSDTKPESLIQSPSRPMSQWLPTVQERIRRSLVPSGLTENDGRWLRQDIGTAASSFFEITSDVLPCEPHLSSSRDGDLVVEFDALHGTMTNIITERFVVLFAVVDGLPIERRLMFGADSPTSMRREVRHLTDLLRTGRHGAVETKS
jgi:hypothetical protein